MNTNSFGKQALKLRFGSRDRIGLYELIASLRGAQTGIVTTLRDIRDGYSQRHDYRAKVVEDWIGAMENGASFAEAMKWWVPSSEHKLIAAGERGHGLDQGLHEAGVLSNAVERSSSAIIGGMIFPLAMMGMLIGGLVVLQVQMMPIFKNMVPIEHWPSSVKNLSLLLAIFGA
jgi:type II secretory pathway component PulF